MSQDAKLFTLNRAGNPNAQYSVGNLAAFADAAATSPADGTGGAPSVTIVRSETTPLEGNGTFLFTKDAANRQGQGFSTDLTLQPSDATKVFTLTFDYQITTGTYTGYQAPSSFSDITMWVYDVTNSVMYQMQGYQLDGAVSSTNQYSYQGQWQVPVGCLTARIIWFLGNTGASAFTARFNNITFGRIPRVQGTVNTPWTTFTPTGSWTTNTTYTGVWQRVGDSMSARVRIALSGTPDAVALTINIPLGLSIDTSKLANSGDTAIDQVGVAILNDASVDTYGAYVYYSTATKVAVSYWADDIGAGANLISVKNAAVTSTAPVTWVNTDSMEIIFSVPILGWGANGTLGQDADSRTIAAKYYMSTSYVITSGLPMYYNTLAYDTNNAATYGVGVTFTYYVPVSGFYKYSFGLRSDNLQTITSASQVAQANLLANGTSFPGSIMGLQSKAAASATYFIQFSGYGMHKFNAGDALVPVINVGTGGASYLAETVPVINYFAIERVSGPAQVQAPEIITARYSTNAGQSISSNSVTVIDFEDKSYDDHGCVTTGAGWKFTAPRQGKVNVTAVATFASNAGWGAGENAYLSVFKNAAEFGRSSNMAQATNTFEMTVRVSDEVDVVAGDTIDIRVFQISGGAIALQSTNALNYVSINFVGGITQ